MLAFIHLRNLPFSVDDVRKMTKSCQLFWTSTPVFHVQYHVKMSKLQSIYKALCQVFSIFGVPAYIHSDRGAAVMSSDL